MTVPPNVRTGFKPAIKITYRTTGDEWYAVKGYVLDYNQFYVWVTGELEGDKIRLTVPRENVISMIETLDD